MPLYETELDLLEEDRIMERFLTYINRGRVNLFSSQKIPLKEKGICVPDFRIISSKGNVVGYAEIRRRGRTWHQIRKWGGQYVSKKKWNMLSDCAAKGYKTAFVVEFPDCFGFYDVGSTFIREGGVRGRTDRNDENDVSGTFLINPQCFQVIGQ